MYAIEKERKMLWQFIGSKHMEGLMGQLVTDIYCMRRIAAFLERFGQKGGRL